MRTGDRIDRVRLSLAFLPLPSPVSDAKVPPLTEVAFLFAELGTTDGHAGLGFSYAKRAGGPALYAHAKEIAPLLLGEDPSDIGRVWEKLAAAGASAGRGGLATQAIAAVDVGLWDLKAKRANLPLAKLLGTHRDAVSCYHTFGGPPAEIVESALESLAQGVGGIKVELGQPEAVAYVRERLGQAVPLMADANQQWDRGTALRVGRALEPLGLTWLEEPLDAHDTPGLAALAAALDTPVATGDVLTSVDSLWSLMAADGGDVLQPDAPRIGGITPFLRVAALADHKRLAIAPNFAAELHVHLAAAYPGTAWVEHVTWLEPLFNERLEVRDGTVLVPTRAGIGLTLSERSRVWTTDRIEFAESV
ncbi:L-talarate/galactarate dehydratase [Actinophytocola oryzae]|uniref:L-alanine-DL-glutamate epimerase-like enolase superfamily enzyme n=1 Tax=Actinophytocola oryzae TaxID=502181 RepID=A0A4R7UNK6_9PSEU|nr:mandelate racemase/muconate lactonizing enzyme family protein [Actinophytocola oryzae]TDV34527.1 L-alanine-DL-glutamate epimerase-like enolase superfamily enzyme [Actinophytocola oryzae]